MTILKFKSLGGGPTYCAPSKHTMEASVKEAFPDYYGPVTTIRIEYLPAWLVGSGNYGWFVRRYDRAGHEYGNAGHAMTKSEAKKMANFNCKHSIATNLNSNSW